MLLLLKMMRMYRLISAILIDFEIGECPAFEISLIFIK